METANTPYRVHQCSKCPGDTEYFCESCPCDMCSQCTDIHVRDSKTKDHDVVSHRDKINYIPTQEICVRHPRHVYTKYCETCQVPVCNSWLKHKSHKLLVRTCLSEHRKHNMLDLLKAHKIKQQKHKGTIHTIRSRAHFYKFVLLPQIKTDFQACQSKLSLCKSEMLTKAKNLSNLIDFLLSDLINSDVRCLKQKQKMSIHISTLQRYEHIYEQSAYSSLQFLSTKKTVLVQIHLKLHTHKLSMTKSFNKENVMESLSAIQITEPGDQRLFFTKLESNEMETANTPYRVHQCSKCPGDTEYFCESCPCDMCSQCKDIHVRDSKTKDHDVVSHRDKVNYIPTQEICVKHPRHVYTKYCEICQVPVCNSWLKHKSHKLLVRTCLSEQRKHNMLDLLKAYKIKQQKHKGTIHTIRSRAHFYKFVLLPQIKTDLQACHSQLSLCKSEMLTKARNLSYLIDFLLSDPINNVFRYFRCLKQIMSIQISTLQRYEHIYEQSVYSPIHFLSTIKTTLSQIYLTLHTGKFSATESFNKENVMESLSAIQITEERDQRLGNECLLKLAFEFHQSLAATGVSSCRHISYQTLGQVWVSDEKNNLILTDNTGVPLHRVEDLCTYASIGLHTVSTKNELIYIDRNDDIKKLSKDMKRTETFVKSTDYLWQTQCVYCSPFTGDLLVGMQRKYSGPGKVMRYNPSGQQTQTIQHDNTGQELYSQPNYITENNNGDIVVSDYRTGTVLISDIYRLSLCGYGTVVVTERGGRHRFSYTGPPSGSKIRPFGVCTDELSNILVCDDISRTIHIIEKDGQPLFHLWISEMFAHCSLSYDVSTHRIWIGSFFNNRIVIYRYKDCQHPLSDLNQDTAVMESLSETQSTETERQQCFKMIPSPNLLHSVTLKGVFWFCHIAFVTSDLVWISDSRNNLILTDITGVPLHRLEDLCSRVYGGIHTVNSKSELIYIGRNHNIYKLSKDLKTTAIFIERTDSIWEPRCVYCSSYNGDLLVAMDNNFPSFEGIELGRDSYRAATGKVTRYDQSGQLTQTIQYDNNGVELYRDPIFITENRNGDVVVSDEGAVVVTERGGRHRFSYTGHPSRSGLEPHGICTDALSHILVCDDRTNTVQMLDKDGLFLLHLLIIPHDEVRSLGYDINTDYLWVGSRWKGKLCVYSYITRQDALTYEHRPGPDGDTWSN